MTTANLGLYQLSTNSPDYEGGASPIASISAALAALDTKHGVAAAAANGAIALTQGLVAITKAGVAALTLALPAAGLPAAAGNDGQILRIVDVGGHAHTVTTPASGLNGASHIATFGGTAASFLALVAYNGSWWVLASSGITLS